MPPLEVGERLAGGGVNPPLHIVGRVLAQGLLCSRRASYAVEAELRVAMPNQPLPAQASVSFFEQTMAGVLRNHQGMGIQQM